MVGDKPVVFSGAVEGFSRSFRARMSNELLADAKALGVDFDRILPAYPLPVWEALMVKVGEVLFGEVPKERRFREMGREFLKGYTETLLGKAAMGAGKVLGPRRMLERMARNFQTGTNYIASQTEVLGEKHVRVTTWMHEPFLAEWKGRPTVMLDYRHGIIEQMLHVLDAARPEVVCTRLDLDKQLAEYEARWG